MGYVVEYWYYEEVEKGEYNKEEKKSGTINVGTPYEDVSLEQLAGKVMALMARRNILVFDVEIYEFAKKKVKFNESSDGIIVKNKKFKFDDGVRITGVEVPDAAPNHQPQPRLIPQPMARETVLRHEIFHALDGTDGELKRRGMAFTEGKRYPILKETDSGNRLGMMYLTVDDNGRQQTISEYFFDREVQLMHTQPVPEGSGDLSWSGIVQTKELHLR